VQCNLCHERDYCRRHSINVMHCILLYVISALFCRSLGGTAAAAPPPSGLATLPSVGAVTHPSISTRGLAVLILCISFCVYIIVCVYVYLVVFVVFFVFCSISFSTLILLVGSFDLYSRLPYNLYCVGGDVKHCSLTHSVVHSQQNTK